MDLCLGKRSHPDYENTFEARINMDDRIVIDENFKGLSVTVYISTDDVLTALNEAQRILKIEVLRRESIRGFDPYR